MCGGGTKFYSLIGTGRYKLEDYASLVSSTYIIITDQKLLWMEDTLFGLNGAPVMPTAELQGIEPAPVLHLYLEELSVMGWQEKNPQVSVMEETAVLEVKKKV